VTAVIDAHVHLGADRAHGFRLSRSELLERMDRSGVDVAVAVPFPAEPMSRANETLAAAIGDRIVGAGLIRPGSPEAAAEVDRVIDDYGMKAVLIDIEATFEYFLAHGVLSGLDTATLDRIAERKLPVYLHTHHPLQRFVTADLAVGVDALARRYPKLPFIVNTRVPSLALVLGHTNVYVDSSLDTASPVDLEAARKLIGAQRLLFASNAPVEHPLIRRMAFERLSCSDGERASMLGGNIAALLRIGAMTATEEKPATAPANIMSSSSAAPPITVAELDRRLTKWRGKLGAAAPATVFQVSPGTRNGG
jgi:predicted TIM-barrel fold metal-dependent hydrolase